MKSSFINTHGVYKLTIDGIELMVMHVGMGCEDYTRSFFFVHFPDKAYSFAKTQMDEEFWWTGYGIIEGHTQLCQAIENLCGAKLVPEPVFDPFHLPGGAEDITRFEVEGIKVEKAKPVYEDVEEIYYRVETEAGVYLTVAYFRLPLNPTWEWRPVSKMTHWDFEFIRELITSYENGDYEKEIRLNDALLALLKTGKQEGNI
jgi:hypothetical protein